MMLKDAPDFLRDLAEESLDFPTESALEELADDIERLLRGEIIIVPGTKEHADAMVALGEAFGVDRPAVLTSTTRNATTNPDGADTGSQ